MSDARPQRKLAAILATDIAGYSRLMGTNEETTLARLNTLNTAVIAPAIEEFRGRIVKTMGDGLLAEFASAVDAVRAAVNIQRGTRSFNADLPTSEQLRLRIGVNIGDLIYQGSDVFGDGVNIAARLQSIAELDGIFVSQAVRDYVREEASFIFDDLGARSLKNIDRPVHVFRVRQPGAAATRTGADRGRRRWALIAAGIAVLAIALGGIGWSVLRLRGPPDRPVRQAGLVRAPPVPRLPALAAAPATISSASSSARPAIAALLDEPRFSLAVLPFRSGGDPKERSLGDGVASRLTAALGRLPGGLVIARETGFTLRGRAAEAKALSEELQVRYLLEGSARREGGQIHVSARLIDGQTGAAAWQGRFAKERAELPALEGDLAASLSAALGVDAEAIKKAVGALTPIASAEADDLALEGWEALYRPASPENSGDAETLFGKALALDAASIEAKLGLAYTLLRGLPARAQPERRARIQRADELLTSLLERMPDHAEALYLKGQVLALNAEPDRSMAMIEQALALDPSLAEGWGYLGLLENRRGHEADSIPYLRRAIRLSPRDSLLAFWLTVIGAGELATGDEAQAFEEMKKASTVNPRFAPPHLWLAAIAARRGDQTTAAAELAEYEKREPGVTIARLKQSGASAIHVSEALVDGLRKAGMMEQ